MTQDATVTTGPTAMPPTGVIPTHIDTPPSTAPPAPPVTTPATAVLALTPPVAEPGYMTTEFWLAIFGNIVSFLVAFNFIHFTNEQTQVIGGLATMAATNIAYALARGIRKNGTSG